MSINKSVFLVGTDMNVGTRKGEDMKATFKQEAIIANRNGWYKGVAQCQLTSDSRGKTLSLLADGVQITIALEPILERLKNK